MIILGVGVLMGFGVALGILARRAAWAWAPESSAERRVMGPAMFLLGLSASAWALIEALSACGRLAPAPLAAGLISISTAAAAVASRLPSPRAPLRLPRDGVARVAVAILLALAVTALVSPPSNWDALTYHLPRIEQWLARGSVEFYPTAIDRQLWLAPLASYLRLPELALTGSDAGFAFYQWGALALALLAVSGTVPLLGAGLAATRAAVVFALAIPMALLQAVTAQNDLIGTAFAMTTLGVAACVRARVRDGRGGVTRRLALWGALVGFALLNKATFAPIAVAEGLLLAYWLRAAPSRPRAAGALALAALLAIAPVSPHVFRCLSTLGTLSGTPLAPSWGIWAAHGPVGLLTGFGWHVARTALLAFDLVFKLDPSLSGPALRAIAALESDPRLAPGLGSAFGTIASGTRLHEDYLGPLAPALAWLILGALALRRGRARGDLAEREIGIAWAVATTLFLVTVTWMPWNSRLLLPIAWVGAVHFGLLWERVRPGPRLGAAVLGGLLLTTLPLLSLNSLHPWIPRPARGVTSVFSVSREVNRFRARPTLPASLHAALDEVERRCAEPLAQARASGETVQIGLDLGPDGWEYPLWVESRARALPIRWVWTREATDAGAVPQLPGADARTLCATVRAREREFDGAYRMLSWPGPTALNSNRSRPVPPGAGTTPNPA